MTLISRRNNTHQIKLLYYKWQARVRFTVHDSRHFMSEGDWKNNAAERKAVLPAAGKARKAIFCQTSGFKQDICDSIAQYSKDRGRKAIFCQTSGLKQDILIR